MRTKKARAPAEVLDDHLRESKVGTIDADLAGNYLKDLVVLTGRAIHYTVKPFQRVSITRPELALDIGRESRF